MDETRPQWETELKALVREGLRTCATSITSAQDTKLMWARRPLQFVEAQTTNELRESWKLFPAWRIEYEKTSGRGQLHEQWRTLDILAKREIAKAFCDFVQRKKRQSVC